MKSMKWLGLLAALVLAGCASAPTVRTESAPGVDFGAYRTFSFATPLSTDRAGFHTLVSQQLVFSTRRELEVRGLQFVADPAQADLLVNFHAHVAEQLRVRSTPDPWVGPTYWHHRRGFYDPWRGHPRWPSHSRIEVDQFTEGQLNVDVIDRRLNMLVWEGVASKRLMQRTMNDLGPALDDAVHRMFRTFPLGPSL
ncbi:DUF4136 domain-containing protein [Thioalkalivibrio sp. XN8]|uniref:DUF4136 domain-containing protein n=1 Tax=Thioalkalivibrio sp. XN8 TaxID=2712863 RepID=UPI0013EDE023|nr:DUF4136 domain-containing protein [Thioalkalivibrio sp. XN8]NGP53148.1 DUF4136 domain-containing protein [Thioalkalivibrio sp. XN8]